MHKYIIDTDFAVTNLLQLVVAEEGQLAELVADLASVEAQLRVHQWDFESSDLNDDFSDAYVMAAFGRMESCTSSGNAGATGGGASSSGWCSSASYTGNC